MYKLTLHHHGFESFIGSIIAFTQLSEEGVYFAAQLKYGQEYMYANYPSADHGYSEYINEYSSYGYIILLQYHFGLLHLEHLHQLLECF